MGKKDKKIRRPTKRAGKKYINTIDHISSKKLWPKTSRYVGVKVPEGSIIKFTSDLRNHPEKYGIAFTARKLKCKYISHDKEMNEIARAYEYIAYFKLDATVLNDSFNSIDKKTNKHLNEISLYHTLRQSSISSNYISFNEIFDENEYIAINIEGIYIMELEIMPYLTLFNAGHPAGLAGLLLIGRMHRSSDIPLFTECLLFESAAEYYDEKNAEEMHEMIENNEDDVDSGYESEIFFDYKNKFDEAMMLIFELDKIYPNYRIEDNAWDFSTEEEKILYQELLCIEKLIDTGFKAYDYDICNAPETINFQDRISIKYDYNHPLSGIIDNFYSGEYFDVVGPCFNTHKVKLKEIKKNIEEALNIMKKIDETAEQFKHNGRFFQWYNTENREIVLNKIIKSYELRT